MCVDSCAANLHECRSDLHCTHCRALPRPQHNPLLDALQPHYTAIDSWHMLDKDDWCCGIEVACEENCLLSTKHFSITCLQQMTGRPGFALHL